MSKKNIIKIFKLQEIRIYLSQNEGLGFLQVFNLLKTLAVVVVSVILAKVVKSHSIISQWETLMLLSGGFTFFYVSGLGYTLFSFIKRYSIDKYKVIFKNSFVLLFLLGNLSCLAIIATEIFSHSSETSVSLIAVFCVYVLGSVCSSIVEYFYLTNKKYLRLLGWGTFNFAALIAVPCILLIPGLDFKHVIFALAILGMLKFSVTIYVLKNPFELNNLEYIKPLLKFNLPVILSLILGTGYIYIANFIIKVGASAEDFNLYRYGSREFPLFVVLANSFSIILGSTTAGNYSDNNFWEKLAKSHLRLLFQIFPLAILLMIFSPYIFRTLFSEQFEFSYRVFNILLLSVIARVCFPQSLLMGRGITKYSFWASLAEFVAGIILSFFLLQKWGIIGVAWAVAIAFFIEKIVLIIFCYKNDIPFHKSLNFRWFLGFSLLLIVSFILNY